MPPVSSNVLVRFADGAPSLEALIGSTPQSICAGVSSPCYLQVNGKTVASSFTYGTLTTFVTLPAGTLSLKARDTSRLLRRPAQVDGADGRKQLHARRGRGVSQLQRASVRGAENVQRRPDVTLRGLAGRSVGRLRQLQSVDALEFQEARQRATRQRGNGCARKQPLSNLGGYVGNASAPLGALTLAPDQSLR